MKNSAKKIKVVKWIPEHIELFQQGLSNQEIAQKTGRSSTAVSVKRTELHKTGLLDKSIKSSLQASLKAKNITAGQKAAATRAARKNYNTSIGSKDLNFIINSIPITIQAGVKNVMVHPERIEINF